MAKNAYCVYTLDYAGHAKSEGLWVHIDNFTTIENDVSDFIIQIINNEYCDLNTFLIGDSMGGAVAINVIIIAISIKIIEIKKILNFL